MSIRRPTNLVYFLQSSLTLLRSMAMPVRGAHQQIRAAVLSWPAAEAHPHRFGGEEYRLGRREIGHIHGDYLVDIPFPRRVRDEVVAAGRAEPHHILPDSGWVSLFIRTPDDVPRAIELLRLSFDLATQKHRPDSLL